MPAREAAAVGNSEIVSLLLLSSANPNQTSQHDMVARPDMGAFSELTPKNQASSPRVQREPCYFVLVDEVL